MIYADFNGSAPLLPSVKDYLAQRIESDLFANPNAIHSMGQKVYQGIEKCRQLISQVMGCYPDQLTFTSGASEGISQIVFSVLEYAPKSKKIVITSPIEHVVVPKTLSFYEERRGFEIKMVGINAEGSIRLDHLEYLLKHFSESVALVAIMAVNNETGVIQPFAEIAKLCHKYEVEFFCDTTQLIGKGHFDFNQSGIDYAVCSGHKVGALTGTGFVLAKDSTRLKSYIFGSSQEKGLRGGTQHYLGIETLAVALGHFAAKNKSLTDLKDARERFETKIKNLFPQVVIIGTNTPRIAGTTLISYPGVHGQAVQIELESHDIFVTTSAACSDNSPETSSVLKAMGVHDDVGRGVIRISLCADQGDEDYQKIFLALKQSYEKLRKIKSF